MRTVMSFVLVLLFALLAGCETYAPTAPTAPNNEKKPAVQSDTLNEECSTCGNPPPPPGGGGG